MRRAVLMSACCVAALTQSGCGLKKGRVEADAVATNRYTRMHLRDLREGHDALFAQILQTDAAA